MSFLEARHCNVSGGLAAIISQWGRISTTLSGLSNCRPLDWSLSEQSNLSKVPRLSIWREVNHERQGQWFNRFRIQDTCDNPRGEGIIHFYTHSLPLQPVSSHLQQPSAYAFPSSASYSIQPLVLWAQQPLPHPPCPQRQHQGYLAIVS